MSKQANMKIGAGLTVPPDVVTMTSAVLGIRGSGKTNTGVVFAEELLGAGHQVIVIDPLNVWWGLKSTADGKGGGFPVVILGGPRGDLPLSEGDGKIVADFLADNRVSRCRCKEFFRRRAAHRPRRGEGDPVPRRQVHHPARCSGLKTTSKAKSVVAAVKKQHSMTLLRFAPHAQAALVASAAGAAEP